jgi:hypothetical protein
MRASKLVVIVYAILSAVSFVKSIGEGALGIGSAFSLLLTLPGSFIVWIFFVWTIIHDGTESVLPFLIPCALLNCILLYKIVTWWNARNKRAA